MFYSVLAIYAALIVIVDQITKYLTVIHLEGKTVSVIPWLFQLTFAKNDGMSFSMLRGGRWFFVIMTIAALVLMALAVKKKWVRHPLGVWALASIAGGAIGNFIDRLRLGYVVDMIQVTFMDFPVFNVADCFVVCGAVLFVVYVLFFDKPQKGEPNDTIG